EMTIARPARRCPAARRHLPHPVGGRESPQVNLVLIRARFCFVSDQAPVRRGRRRDRIEGLIEKTRGLGVARGERAIPEPLTVFVGDRKEDSRPIMRYRWPPAGDDFFGASGPIRRYALDHHALSALRPRADEQVTAVREPGGLTRTAVR